MNILMMTNTYTPLIGGLERSVREFTAAFRKRGHRVLVAAPEFEGMPEEEGDVIRVPAIRQFNRSVFSLKLPMPRALSRALAEFHPDLVHAHHPFLMGSTALRLAHTRKLPLVFTHHTRFEYYTHMLSTESHAIQRFVVELSTGYANLCERVFAPSESIAQMLTDRGVTTPLDIVPTGVQLPRFAAGSRAEARRALGISPEAFVVGHVGRLSPEKNLGFLTNAVARFLRRYPSAYFLVAGHGPLEEELRHLCQEAGISGRLQLAGVLRGRALSAAYRSMDVFAFASESETQGLVVTEAMAAGVPVVALDAPGVREVVEEGRNGRLLRSRQADAFAAALAWIAEREPEETDALRRAAIATAERFAMPRCADHALACYADVLACGVRDRAMMESSRWAAALRRITTEWRLLKTITKATAAAVKEATPRCRRQLVPARG